MPQFLSYFDYPSNFRQGGITASILAGAFAGSILTGAFLADRLGRKKTMLLGSAIFTIGCAISAAANGLAALVAGRLINGLGNGCLAMMVGEFLVKDCEYYYANLSGTTLPRRNQPERVRASPN
jgi:MFS family permease